MNPVAVNAPASCQWGYNYTVDIEYEISFTGSNPPNSLHTLQGTLGCGSNSQFFDLPNSGGSGVVTTANTWASSTNCATATPESLGCNTISIAINGPSMSNQTISCPISFDPEPEPEEEDEEEDEPVEPTPLEGEPCVYEVTSSQGYTVQVELQATGIEILTDPCDWGFNYNTEIAYNVNFVGNNAPPEMWTLHGYMLCDGNEHYFSLPNGGGSGNVTSVSNVWVGEPTCDTSTLESLGCNNFVLVIQGPGISTQEINCEFDPGGNEDPTDGPELVCPDDIVVIDEDMNCVEEIEVPAPTVLNLPEETPYANASYLSLPNNNDYVAIENLSFEGFRPAITAEAWLKTTESGAQQVISFQHNRHFQLTVGGNGNRAGKPRFSVSTNQGNRNLDATSRVDDGEWHHIAGVYDNGAVRIFVDGVLENSTTRGSTIGHNNTRFGFIGCISNAASFNGSRGNGQYFRGDIKEVKLWDIALAAEDMMPVMGPDPATEGLLLWYDFSEGDGTALADKSVNANNGQLFNATANHWKSMAAPYSYTLTNDFNNTSDASGEYPPGVTTVTWTLSGPNGVIATCTQTIEVVLADPDMVCDNQFDAYVWRGTLSDEWDVAGNWLGGVVPPDMANVTINTDNHHPNIASTVQVNNLLISEGSEIEFEFSSATIKIAGDFVNNGTFAPANGKLTFNGSGTRLIKGNNLPIFHDLKVDAGDTLRLLTDMHLTGALQPMTGVFDWNGRKVTLLSDLDNTGSIGEIKSGAEILGDSIIYNRFFPTGPGSWRMLCSPLTDVTFEQWNDDIPTTGFPGADFPTWPNANNPWASIRWYDETISGDDMHSGFVAIENITTPIENGEGYFTYFVPNSTTIEMEGTFKRGSHTWELDHTNSQSDPYQDGWNLLGNPFPSAIDWDAATGWNKSGLASAVYAFNPINGQYSSYINGISLGEMDGKIGSLQAFWVKAEGAGATLSINERAKINTGGVFLKSSSNATQSVVRIKLETNNENVYDETVVGFHNGATDEFDPELDAFKFYASNATLPNIATRPEVENSRPMGISMLPLAEEEVVVNLIVRKGSYSDLTLRNTLVDTFDDDLCLVLEDRELEVMASFNQGESYSFTPGEMELEERFALHVSAPLEVIVFDESCNGSDDGRLIAQGFGQAPWTFTWFDEMGQIISTTAESTIADVLEDLTPGFYEVQVDNSSEHCSVINKVVQVKAAPDGEIMTMATPATCNLEADGEIDFETDDFYTWSFVATGTKNDQNFSFEGLQGDTTVTGLTAGLYTVTATNHCGNSLELGAIDLRDPRAVEAGLSATSLSASLATGAQFTFINNSSANANMFYWYFGDGNADSTSYEPQHSYTSTGAFTVTLRAENETCEDTTELMVSVSGHAPGFAGTNGMSEADLETYAELAKPELAVTVVYEKLRIATNEAVEENVTVTIFSISGQRVLQQEFGSLQVGNTEVDIAPLQQGIYTYGIQTKAELLESGEFMK